MQPQPPPTEPPPRSRQTQIFSRPGHGGAWKVAYADFVTALMALFIVLWMMNSSAQVKSAISGYFRDPRGYTKKLGAGPAAAGEGMPLRAVSPTDMRGQIEQALRRMPEYERLKENIRMSVTGEGLRVELLETETGLFFVAGSAEPAEAGQHLLRTLAGELARLPNTLIIEGHTDARPFRNAAPSKGYSNWELSADRANAARRLLHQWGVRPGQIVEVRGFAEENPIDAAQPNNPRNRRVSIVVRFQ